MNKYQKAFNLLTGKETSPCYECKTYHCEDCEHFKESSRVLSELVDKATPMKPLDIDEALDPDFDITYLVGYCPNCNSPVNEYQKGCSQCLQALDWSNEDV